jgi:hypothetical protein
LSGHVSLSQRTEAEVASAAGDRRYIDCSGAVSFKDNDGLATHMLDVH